MARVSSDYDPEADVLEQGAYELEDEAGPDLVPDPAIIDLTSRSDKSHRKGRRDPKKVYALVLHQMACCFRPRDPLKRFLTIGSHFAITSDGRILQLHPISALVWASNGFNARSVAVEFAGNFPNIKGTWWKGDEYGRNRLTQAQVNAGRYLIRYLMRTNGLTHVLAHRQSSGTRENDPGPDIWRHVGQWAVDTLGLKDGGPGFKIGTGHPIPAEWRTWSVPPVVPELEAVSDEESPDTELAHDVWQGEEAAQNPEYVRWVQRSLNEVLGLRLPLDGVAGPSTRGAVRSFQARHGLPVSGVVGTDTEDVLKAAPRPSGFRSRRWSRRESGLHRGAREEGEESMETGTPLPQAERPFVAGLIAAGERDPNKLTDRVFFLRHKELGGRRIAPGETALKQEWWSILRQVVQPALASSRLPTKPPSAPPSAGGGDVAHARRIAAVEVPRFPGTTIEQFVERWRRIICPEIPWSVLLAFIKYEAGGRLFEDATHGKQDNRWTSPEFYELGLFQTPGGLHGRCTGPDSRSCEFDPPGKEKPGDPSTWVRLCAVIKADPQDWKNPTTQVRVGLLDLERGADSLRKDFPELFSRPGTDWDLRMAVLYRFSRGGGYARSFLSQYRRQLAAMPEGQRWNFLRGKTATAVATVSGKRVTVQREFRGENVEEKMALAAKLSQLGSSKESVPVLVRESDDREFGTAFVTFEPTQPASILCDSDSSEGFPLIRRGSRRAAVGYAQNKLNVMLKRIFEECMPDPPCWNQIPKLNQEFIQIEITKLTEFPLIVDCKFGPNTERATKIFQAFMFKASRQWDGIIGPDTWHALEAATAPPEPPVPTLPPIPRRPAPVFL